MAEIKSTLDLVLERTKNLTMTSEERDSFRRKELEGKIRGWVQRFLDGFTDLEGLKSEMDKTEDSHREEARDILKAVLLEHIAPEKNNDKILDAMERFLGLKKEPYQKSLREFQKKLSDERSKIQEKIREDLAGRHISGSAVIPNVQRDGDWKALSERVLAEFRKSIRLIPDS